METKTHNLRELTVKPISGNKAKQAVFLLHGLGANAEDLFELIPYFNQSLPDCEFISLNAPFPCDMAPTGWQWFSLQDRSEESILDGVKEANKILNQYLDEKIKSLGLKEENIALIGFSQGTMLSLHTALRRNKAFAGVLGYSGALVSPYLLKDELKSKPKFCIIHGEADPVVPFQAFTEIVNSFKKYDIDLQAYSREGLGHGIDPQGIQIGVEFLKSIF